MYIYAFTDLAFTAHPSTRQGKKKEDSFVNAEQTTTHNQAPMQYTDKQEKIVKKSLGNK